MAVYAWSVDDVINFLQTKGLNMTDYSAQFVDNEIDGATFLSLTESMISRLAPRMKDQVLLLKVQGDLSKSASQQTSSNQPAENDVSQSPSTSSAAVSQYPSTSSADMSINSIRDPESPAAASFDLGSPSQQNGIQVTRATYILPTFPQEVMLTLGKKSRQPFLPGCRLRSLIVTSLFEDLTRRKIWYPSKNTYGIVCSTLVCRFPFLMDPDGTDSSWRKAIKNKFKSERRDPSLTSDAVVAKMKESFGRPGVSGRKRKQAESDNEIVVTKTARFKTNNLAMALAGEDEKTRAKHIRDLQAELKKAHPDLGVVADKMKRTATFRQSQCLESATAVVLESFPALRLHSFLVGDALSMCGVDVTNIRKLVDYADSIQKLVAQKWTKNADVITKLKQMTASVNAAVEETLDEDIRLDIRLQFAMELVLMYFGEKDALVFAPNEEGIKAPTPCLIKTRDRFTLMFDGIRLLSETEPCMKALQAWLATYWVFNVNYPEALKCTMLFIQKYILKNKVATPGPVDRFAGKLNM